MKFLRMIWLLGIFFFGLLDNAVAQDKPRCVEYQISKAPVQCGPGYTGMKVPVVTFTCPDRRQVESFDTTGCIPAGTQPKNPLATNCSVTPGDAECMPLPKPSGCPAGKHWTTQGSGIAHCVGDDINCPAGQTLTHDALGNPSCVPISCPSNQVLQADGKTCACPAGTTWNGATCERPAAFCPPKKVTAINCPSGMAGQGIRTTTYTLPNCAEQVSDDFSQCNRNECPAPSSVTSACPAGQTGSIVTTTSYIGVACTPVSNTNNNCTEQKLICPADSQQTIACPAGFTGIALLKTTFDNANNCARTDSVDNAGCKKNTKPAKVIEFAKSYPEYGVIGSQDICNQNGFGPILTNNESIWESWVGDIQTASCTGTARGEPWAGFTFVPANNGFFSFIFDFQDPRNTIPCLQNLDQECSLIWYSWAYYYIQTMEARNFMIQNSNYDFLIINGNGPTLAGSGGRVNIGRFVRQGQVIGMFQGSDDSRFGNERFFVAPSDGFLFMGVTAPHNSGSAG